MITAGTNFSLKQYQEDGYSGPVQGISLQDAERYYQNFFDVLGQSRYAPSKTDLNLSAWHHKYRWAYDLATHSSIVSAMQEILGPDVVLWAMHFWYKEPNNDKFIPWHQDINYWPMEPEINATAWVSLGYSVTENGCLRIIPGTHKAKVAHRELDDATSAFGQGIDGTLIDENQAIDVEMTPGQITFFNERTFHGSNRNTSNIARVAFSVRYTTPAVKFKIDQWSGVDRIKTFLVTGEDRYHLNDSIIGVPPVNEIG
jgi:ectoine hydroxylase-related dioxygenase (phytanoyl-CoA dioxygenase family)